MRSATSSMSISPSDLPLIQGTWFDGRSARACAAALRPQSADLCWLEAEAQQCEVFLTEVSVSARIGQIPRRLTFADGSYFETADNDGIDVLMAARGSSRGWVSWLERQWKVALLALLGVAGICILLVTVVLPRLATRIADAVPTSVDAQIGAGVLRTLDGRLLLPSTLSPQRQKQLQTQFAAVTADSSPGTAWQLQLRDAKSIGPNAFAFPGGTVVMTDQLANLAQNDEELLSVLAHEAGHVYRRHGLRQLVQGLGISALAMIVLGDVSSITSLAGAAPALLQASYSRDMEREADAYSRDWLNRHGIPPQRFDDLLCRLAASDTHSNAKNTADYFASHPAVSDRAHCP